MVQPTGSLAPLASVPKEIPAPILSVPKDVIFNCFSFLNIRDVTACSLVCKTWLQFTNDNRLWNLLIKRDFPDWGKRAVNNARQVYQGLKTNLANGLYATKMIPASPSGICTFIASKEELLVSGSYDGSIEVWDLKKEQLEPGKIIQAHVAAVGTLAFTHGGHLISSSQVGGEIKVWDLKAGDCLNTFQVQIQPDSNTCLVVTQEDLLILGESRDGTIKILDLKTGQCIATLQGHTGGITDLILTKEDRLISSSWDGTIKMWDLKTGKCLKTTPSDGFTNKLCLVLTEKEDQLISGSDNGEIKFWDLNTLEGIDTIETYNLVTTLYVTKDHLISSSNIFEITIWDLKTHKCLTILQGTKFKPYCLVFTKAQQLLAPLSSSTNIQVWDFTASNEAIFKDLAEKLKEITKTNSELEYRIWLERFLRMPKKEKEQIYSELYEIQKPLITNGSLQYGERVLAFAMAFSATQQIAQAITNYLGNPLEVAEKPSEVFQYLTDTLQITAHQRKVFFEKTEFAGTFVEHVGLVNSVDLQAIGINPQLMEHLAQLQGQLKNLSPKSEQKKQTDQHLALKTITPVKDSIESLLVTLLPLVELGKEVITVPDRLNSLISMQSSLIKRKVLLEQITESPESCNRFINLGKLFEFANKLLAEFTQFEQCIKHSQIELLNTYLSQPSLNEIWDRMQANGFSQATQLTHQLNNPSEFYRL